MATPNPVDTLFELPETDASAGLPAVPVELTNALALLQESQKQVQALQQQLTAYQQGFYAQALQAKEIQLGKYAPVLPHVLAGSGLLSLLPPGNITGVAVSRTLGPDSSEETLHVNLDPRGVLEGMAETIRAQAETIRATKEGNTALHRLGNWLATH